MKTSKDGLHIALGASSGFAVMVAASHIFADHTFALAPPEPARAHPTPPEKNKKNARPAPAAEILEQVNPLAFAPPIPAADKNQRFTNLAQKIIQEYEGLSLSVGYCTSGLPTIGYGCNLEANKTLFQKALGINATDFQQFIRGKKQLTKDQAEILFLSSLQQAEQNARNKLSFDGISFDTLTDRQQAALVSLAFNNPALIGSKLRKAIKHGNWVAAACEIALNSNAKKIWGLARRREAESVLFLGRQLTPEERQSFLKRSLTRQEQKQASEYAGKEISVSLLHPAEAAWRLEARKPQNTVPTLRLAAACEHQSLSTPNSNYAQTLRLVGQDTPTLSASERIATATDAAYRLRALLSQRSNVA